jgi:Mg2+-importing ATPase
LKRSGQRQPRHAFWSVAAEELKRQLGAGPGGLAGVEARRRIKRYGPNHLKPVKRADTLTLLLAQFGSPLIIILLLAAALSFFFRETTDAVIIIAIVLLSGLLGFWQEKRAADAVAKLLAVVRVNVQVLRDGSPREVALEEVVPGDVLLLSAGDIIPADCLILESKDLYVDEAALTGESFPEEKRAGTLLAETPLGARSNALFMGTHVISGSARALAALTGMETEFGRVSERLRGRPAEAEFERGIRRFGYLLTEVTLVMVVAIFGVSALLERPILDSFLFALALAVGLIPELLPAIISINLAAGAVHMARRKVIVKQLASIENFGSMNVLCVDKTGTLTEGVVRLHSALDAAGVEGEKALLYAYLNASFESGFTNPIDEAVRARGGFDISGWKKLDEVPYDFTRKRLSVLVSHDGAGLLVTKGALGNVLEVCSTVETPGGKTADIEGLREGIERRFEDLGRQGFRVLGIAYKDADAARARVGKEDEAGMTFLGFLVFYDPPKAGISQAIADLKELGITLKIITGDNRFVAASVARQVTDEHPALLAGDEIGRMNDDALRRRAGEVDVFAEVEPSQKERIIRALRQAGNVVGYLGDGINDAPALHAADVSLSVNSAVDVAKEAANIVLLEKDLGVLGEGVREGRRTFANTLKYVYMTTSANFGNMFSMAGAALFLPFLPLLPKQILLNNFLTDFPAMAIATDRVDRELVERPRRWDIRFIRDFMIAFGAVSSVFDFLTFGTLILVLRATPEQFRTGWFIESVMTELLIVPVIRTWKPFYRSLPSRALLVATVVVFGVTLALPYYSPLSSLLGLAPLPLSYLALLGAITALYLCASEMTKKFFYRRLGLGSAQGPAKRRRADGAGAAGFRPVS